MRTSCSTVRSQFSEYLDGRISGVSMQKVALHLGQCSECYTELERWKQMQRALAELGSIKAPKDLALRLRVAISQERTKTPGSEVARWKVYWKNTLAPLALQASAGFASTVLLLGTVILMVGMFAKPEPLAAQDEPIGMASTPRFLYSDADKTELPGRDIIGQKENPVVVEAYIGGDGRVYDYQIVSGPTDAHTRSQIENLLLFSVFEPARFFGAPVRGLAVMSFAGVSVRG
jgi:Putative zinc-finger